MAIDEAEVAEISNFIPGAALVLFAKMTSLMA
jgi:hypothetical protein